MKFFMKKTSCLRCSHGDIREVAISVRGRTRLKLL